MNERLRKITGKMERGEPVIGVFVLLADASVSEIVGYSGCDFVWIDSEHGMMDRREIYHHVLAAQSAGACAFVRVPGVEYYQIKNTLDMGPDGVIFPFVNTPEIAKVPGYHSLFVGPADLGMSMTGIDPEDKPALIADIQRRTARAAAANGKYCGSCAGPSKESCRELQDRGVQWMTIAQDARILSAYLADAVRKIRT